MRNKKKGVCASMIFPHQYYFFNNVKKDETCGCQEKKLNQMKSFTPSDIIFCSVTAVDTDVFKMQNFLETVLKSFSLHISFALSKSLSIWNFVLQIHLLQMCIFDKTLPQWVASHKFKFHTTSHKISSYTKLFGYHIEIPPAIQLVTSQITL